MTWLVPELLQIRHYKLKMNKLMSRFLSGFSLTAVVSAGQWVMGWSRTIACMYKLSCQTSSFISLRAGYWIPLDFTLLFVCLLLFGLLTSSYTVILLFWLIIKSVKVSSLHQGPFPSRSQQQLHLSVIYGVFQVNTWFYRYNKPAFDTFIRPKCLLNKFDLWCVISDTVSASLCQNTSWR